MNTLACPRSGFSLSIYRKLSMSASQTEGRIKDVVLYVKSQFSCPMYVPSNLSHGPQKYVLITPKKQKIYTTPSFIFIIVVIQPKLIPNKYPFSKRVSVRKVQFSPFEHHSSRTSSHHTKPSSSSSRTSINYHQPAQGPASPVQVPSPMPP